MGKAVLPWPDARLNPNRLRRSHWSVRSRAMKEARASARRFLEAAGVTFMDGPLDVAITFRPPDARRRDTDNMIAAAKPLIDAIADVTACDDSKFHMTFMRAEPTPGGAVEVSVIPASTGQPSAG